MANPGEFTSFQVKAYLHNVPARLQRVDFVRPGRLPGDVTFWGTIKPWARYPGEDGTRLDDLKVGIVGYRLPVGVVGGSYSSAWEKRLIWCVYFFTRSIPFRNVILCKSCPFDLEQRGARSVQHQVCTFYVGFPPCMRHRHGSSRPQRSSLDTNIIWDAKMIYTCTRWTIGFFLVFSFSKPLWIGYIRVVDRLALFNIGLYKPSHPQLRFITSSIAWAKHHVSAKRSWFFQTGFLRWGTDGDIIFGIPVYPSTFGLTKLYWWTHV